jgi:hypothetical protein
MKDTADEASALPWRREDPVWKLKPEVGDLSKKVLRPRFPQESDFFLWSSKQSAVDIRSWVASSRARSFSSCWVFAVAGQDRLYPDSIT